MIIITSQVALLLVLVGVEGKAVVGVVPGVPVYYQQIPGMYQYQYYYLVSRQQQECQDSGPVSGLLGIMTELFNVFPNLLNAFGDVVNDIATDGEPADEDMDEDMEMDDGKPDGAKPDCAKLTKPRLCYSGLLYYYC